MAFIWFPPLVVLLDAPAEPIIEVVFDPAVAPRKRTAPTVFAEVTPDPPPPEPAIIEVFFDPRTLPRINRTLESHYLTWVPSFNDFAPTVFDPRVAPKKKTLPSHFVQFTYGFNDFAETDFDPAVAPQKRTAESVYNQDAPPLNDMVVVVYDPAVAPKRRTLDSVTVDTAPEEVLAVTDFIMATFANEVYIRRKTQETFISVVTEEGAVVFAAEADIFPFIHNMGTMMQRA